MLLSSCGELLCEHTFVDANCTTAKTCSLCGKERGAPLGHDFIEATCETAKTCTTCGFIEGSPLGHNYTEATCKAPKICLNCGSCSGEPLEHNYSSATCESPATCTFCQEIKGSALGHNYKNATCITPKICSRCSSTTGTSLGHTWRAATCESPEYCSRCLEVGDNKALGHSYIEATCTSAKICKTCGTKSGSSLGHLWKSATCTTPKTCTRCSITSGSALGHSWKAATCTTAKTCSTCNVILGSAIGHNFVSGKCKTCKAIDPNYIEYTVIYNSNGGWGETVNSTHLYGEARALSVNGFKRAGYTFVGWHTDSKATSPKYTNTQSVKNLSKENGGTVILYAIWKESKTAAFDECKPLANTENSIAFHQSGTDNTGKTHNDVAVLEIFPENIGTYVSRSERYTSGLFKKIKGTIYCKEGKHLDDNSYASIAILADGEKVYESAPMSKYSSCQSFEVNISGASSVKIYIKDCSDSIWGYGAELMIENLILER